MIESGTQRPDDKNRQPDYRFASKFVSDAVNPLEPAAQPFGSGDIAHLNFAREPKTSDSIRGTNKTAALINAERLTTRLALPKAPVIKGLISILSTQPDSMNGIVQDN